FIAAHEDDPKLNIRIVGDFFVHVLRRVSWESSLHFTTRTTMDTLDYSGGAINEGSKLMLAVSGAPRRELSDSIPPALLAAWPEHWSRPRLVMPGVLVFGGAAATGENAKPEFLAALLEEFTAKLRDAGLL